MEQRLSLITLGVRDLARARRFYEQGLGWRPSAASTDQVAFYQIGGLALSLFARAALAAETGQSAAGDPTGFALALNVPSPEDVDTVLADAQRAGASLRATGQPRSWGGYTGYFADPDGHTWEIAWNPHFQLLPDGSLQLPT